MATGDTAGTADLPGEEGQPRPRPTPHGRRVESQFPTRPDPERGEPTRVEPQRGGNPVRIDQVQPSELVAAAGNAVVTAARLGRLLTRTGWRVARQLPGGQAVEQQVQRVGAIATRALDLPQSVRPRPRPTPRPSPTGEELRAARLIQNADPGQSPLRGAMQELLQRSVESNRGSSREYLFGTIISQLVPDEARIVAALSDGSRHAAADVVVKKRRKPAYTALANASTIGRAAGVTTPDNVPTYLRRLHGLGLIEFGPEAENLSTQYEILAADDTVRQARHLAGGGRAAKIVRKSIALSPLGREFWAATDPSRPALATPIRG